MAGSEREKLKRKVSGKVKRKPPPRPMSGTPPRLAQPFSGRERSRLLQALRECAQAVDSANPGGSVPDRVKMEGLLRCLTHSINLLERDARLHKLETPRSSSALDTDQGPSSSPDSSFMCRGPNLNSALTSINFEKNKTSRRTCSTNSLKRTNILEKSSSSTICGDGNSEIKVDCRSQTTTTNEYEHDGDESSNAQISTASSVFSQRTVVHLDAKNQCDFAGSEKDNIKNNVQAATGLWLSSYLPTPLLTEAHLFATPSRVEMKTARKNKVVTDCEKDMSQDEISLSTTGVVSRSSIEGKEKRSPQSVSPRSSFSAKKELSMKALSLRKSAPQERTSMCNTKVGRERSVYTVRKRDPLNSTGKKRYNPREGDNSRTRGPDKSLVHNVRESTRDGLRTSKIGIPEGKMEKMHEITTSKSFLPPLQKSTSFRQGERRIKTADSTSKRTTCKRPISRSSVKGKVLLEPPLVKNQGVLSGMPNQLTRNDVVQEKTGDGEKERKEFKQSFTGGVSENLKINVTPTAPDQDEKPESVTKKRGSARRVAKSRKSKLRDKLKNAPALKKSVHNFIQSSSPHRKEEKPMALDRSRLITKLNNLLTKTNSESRILISPKRYLKSSSELTNAVTMKTQGCPPRLTSSEKKMEKKSETSKRTSAMERPLSRSSLRWNELQIRASTSHIPKVNSRASDRKPASSSAKRGLKRRHSGIYLNKIGTRSLLQSGRRSNGSQTKCSARSSKNNDEGSTPPQQFQRCLDYMSKSQNRSAKSRSRGSMNDISRGSQKSSSGLSGRNDAKKLQLKKSNSGLKNTLDKSFSANFVSKDEKLASSTLKQLMITIPKSASFTQTVVGEPNSPTSKQEMANDSRNLLKTKQNSGKDRRVLPTSEKFSSSDLRRLLAQRATKKKKVTFACFDQLQSPCARRLKSDYVDRTQKNISKTSEYVNYQEFLKPSNGCSSCPQNEVNEFNTSHKTRSNLLDSKDEVSSSNFSKHLKSILLSANKGFTKEELQQAQHYCSTSEPRTHIRSARGECDSANKKGSLSYPSADNNSYSPPINHEHSVKNRDLKNTYSSSFDFTDPYGTHC